MSGPVLFDVSYRGDLWRLELATHDGRTFGNWRKWYWDGDTLRPTREGCTFAPERLVELEASLAAWRTGKEPSARSAVK
jgi:hypothetical protein